MKEKIKKILNPRFLIVLLTIILVFTLTTYWRNETKKSINDWRTRNGFEKGQELQSEEFTALINYEIYVWNVTYQKIWIYNLLILTSGILLLVATRRDNNL